MQMTILQLPLKLKQNVTFCMLKCNVEAHKLACLANIIISVLDVNTIF